MESIFYINLSKILQQRELRSSVEELHQEQEILATETDSIVKSIGDTDQQQLTAGNK